MPPPLSAADLPSCPHGGRVAHVPAQVRVLVHGSPALVAADVGTVAGCAFTLPSSTPSPCLTVRWSGAATRVSTLAGPLVAATSTGTCASAAQAPQGPAVVPPPPPRVQVL